MNREETQGTLDRIGFGRITLTLLCFILVAILLPTCIAGYIFITSQKKQYELNYQQDRSRLLNTLSATLATPVWNVRVDQIDEIVSSFMTLPYLLEVSVMDTIIDKEVYKKESDYQKTLSNINYISTDIVRHKVIGKVGIVTSSDYYDQQLKEQIEKLLFLFVFLFIATSILVGVVIYRFLLTPLLRLVQRSLNTDLPSQCHNSKWESPIEKIKNQIILLLRESERYYNIVDQHVHTLRLDGDGKIISRSAAFTILFGDAEKISFFSKPFEEKFRTCLQHAYDEGRYSGETCLKGLDGGEIYLNCSITADYEGNGQLKGFVVVCEDVTDKKLIEKIAVTDKLTGLYNRVKLDEQLAMCVELNNRYQLIFSVIIMDVDFFKSVNDTHGHLAGDKVLQGIAQLLRENSRRTDLVGRWGGEEFIIICPNIDLIQGRKFAENLRKTINEALFADKIRLSASFGVGTIGKGEDLEHLIKRVDDALYTSKEQGRNRVTAI